MYESTPVARSPIAPAEPEVLGVGWMVSGRRSAADLTMVDLAPVAKVGVRADPSGSMSEALETMVGSAVVTCAAPGEWLVLAAPEDRIALVAELEQMARGTGDFVTVVDLTHGRALMRLTGHHAAGVLAKECAVDLSDRGCPDGRSLRTRIAGLAVDVVRDDRTRVPSYLLHCERSSGQYLFDVLLEAGAEHGIDVDGFRSPWTGSSEGPP